MNNKQDNSLPITLFQPCGIDDLIEREVAEFLEPLPGLALASRADEDETRNDDDNDVVKEENMTLATIYQENPSSLNILKARLAGEAPWLEDSIPYPLVKLEVPYSPRGVYFDYEPKIFFLPERTYEDWLEMDGVKHLFHWRLETREVCSEASPFSYTQTWYCHCAGKPEIKKKAEGKKRRQIFKSSKHVGCLARVYVHKYKGDHPPAPGYPPVNASKRVRLTYYGRHTGHVLGEHEGFQHLSISKSVREAILGYIKQGLGKRAIKDKFTLHSDDLQNRLSMGTITRDDFVTSVDISNIYDTYWKEKTQEHSNCRISLSVWADKREAEGNFIFRWDKATANGSTSNYGYGFSSQWQLEKLRASRGAIGLDSTHNACKGSAGLYTVIVQDPQTMRGIPVGFFLTDDKSAEPLQCWLNTLEAHTGIMIRYITTDDSLVEYRAIKDAFGDRVQIHLCLWHIARAWDLKIKKLVTDDNPQRRFRLQADANKALHKIMYESDMQSANRMIVAFRQVWAEVSKPLVDYMDDNYFAERRRQLWMKSYRPGVYYASMDTNNYIESWHNQLESNYLKYHCRARADRVLYILTEVVLEAVRKAEGGAIIHVGRRTKGEVLDILRQRQVQSMTEEIIQRHVHCIDGRYTVESMTISGLYYDLSQIDGLLNNCSCEYFTRHQRVCKHILMAIRKFPGELGFPFNNSLDTPKTHTDNADMDHSALDVDNEDLDHDEGPEDEREQRRLHDRIQTLTESIHRYTRNAIVDEELIRLLEQVVDYGSCLPEKNGDRKQKQEQK